VIIHKRLAAQRVQHALSVIVTAKNKHVWHVCEPFLTARPFCHQVADFRPQILGVDDDDVALLKIAFGWCAQSQRAELPQNPIRYGLLLKCSRRPTPAKLNMNWRRVTMELYILGVWTEAMHKGI
jgi:hypothetical protein